MTNRLVDAPAANGPPASAGMRDIHHKMKFRAVMMTPAAAKELLTKNHPKNRKPKDSRINLYAQDIVNGLWTLTHEGVAIDEDGWLIDGQNRLEAIVLADKPAPILLVTGVPRGAMLAVDQGCNRNVVDVSYVTDQHRPTMSNWAAAARAMAAGTRGTSIHRMSVQETLAFIKAHEKALEFAITIMPAARFLSQAGVRAVLARAYYLPKARHERVREFAQVLVTGLQNGKKDTAAVRLRNWLLDSFSKGKRKRLSGMKPKATIVYGKTEAALSAFLEERPLEFLRETAQELFPLPDERKGKGAADDAA